MNGDAVDKAIEAEGTVTMLTLPVTIASSGRPFTISVPADTTDAELLEILGWMATALAGALRGNRERKARSGLVIARSVGKVD